MPGYEVISDSVGAGIRVAVLRIGDFEAVVTHDEALGDTSVAIRGTRGIFAPDMRRMGPNKYSFCYDHAVIFPDCRADFENDYYDAVEFCEANGDVIEGVISKMRNKEMLI